MFLALILSLYSVSLAFAACLMTARKLGIVQWKTARLGCRLVKKIDMCYVQPIRAGSVSGMCGVMWVKIGQTHL